MRVCQGEKPYLIQSEEKPYVHNMFSETANTCSSPILDVSIYQGEKPCMCSCDVSHDNESTNSIISIMKMSVSLGENSLTCQICSVVVLHASILSQSLGEGYVWFRIWCYPLGKYHFYPPKTEYIPLVPPLIDKMCIDCKG